MVRPHCRASFWDVTDNCTMNVVRRVAWPVPQVIVRYGNLEQAWGREGLKQLGLQVGIGETGRIAVGLTDFSGNTSNDV